MTPEQELAIRVFGATGSFLSLASKFGVGHATVCGVLSE